MYCNNIHPQGHTPSGLLVFNVLRSSVLQVLVLKTALMLLSHITTQIVRMQEKKKKKKKKKPDLPNPKGYKVRMVISIND